MNIKKNQTILIHFDYTNFTATYWIFLHLSYFWNECQWNLCVGRLDAEAFFLLPFFFLLQFQVLFLVFLFAMFKQIKGVATDWTAFRQKSVKIAPKNAPLSFSNHILDYQHARLVHCLSGENTQHDNSIADKQTYINMF